MTRILFLGNSEGFSHHFAEALAERTIDPADPVQLVGIVSPRRFGSTPERVRFAAKRRASRLVHRPDVRALVGPLLTGRATSTTEQLQRHASRLGIPLSWPATAGRSVVAAAEATRADLCLVAGLDRILSASTIAALPPVVNVHPSLLPHYRGPSPDFWQLDDAVPTSGVTLHRIDAGVDTGPILLQAEFPVAPWQDRVALRDAGVACGLRLLHELLDDVPGVLGRGVPQPVAGSQHPKPGPLDRIVPFERGAWAVHHRARAFGWPEPLHLHVDPIAWSAGEAVAIDPSGAARLDLYGPAVLDHDLGVAVGAVRRVEPGGAVVQCADGTVLFHRAVLAVSPTR